MDEAVDGIIARSRNFGYLEALEPLLAFDGATAESYVYTDPDAAMARCRRFVDTLTRKAVAVFGLSSSAKTLNERIKALEAAGVLGPNLVKACHEVRKYEPAPAPVLEFFPPVGRGEPPAPATPDVAAEEVRPVEESNIDEAGT